MALIKCSECAAEISDKAACCPKCGASVNTNKRRCSKCGNIISEEPCPHCSGESTITPAANITSNENNAAAVPEFVTKNKRNLHVLIFSLLAVAAIVFVIFISQGSSSRVKHGKYFDCYDDDGDGWVDRIYSREFHGWNYNFYPGLLSMDDAA